MHTNERLEQVIRDVIAPAAPEVDRAGSFPSASLEALREAGFLGLISAKEMGGQGEGSAAAVATVERVARACGSTAMVLAMHYAGTVVIERFGDERTRREIAAGRHLSTLAFSESGSRSHFWAPVSTARREGDGVRLDASKSWVTSASHATAYVWSSRPLDAQGESTIWLVPRESAGVRAAAPFDGLGLRGNDSSPVVAEDARVPEANRLGEDGGGLSVMLNVVLPLFSAMNAACSVGLMERAVAGTVAHVTGTRYQHLGSTLADLPTIRAYVARMKIATDQSRLLLEDTVRALEGARADAMLRVLEVKAAAGESATQVTDLAMRVCGGAAFRREVGVERAFRDARAATVMAPTTDQLYDFIGRALCGLPVLG
jgi:alkylation response protein AidB-like acyl-CoA dehydrogenase